MEWMKEKRIKPSEYGWKEPCSVGENLPDKIGGRVAYAIHCDVVLFSGQHALYFSCYHEQQLAHV